jgi:hypothetical protein
MRHHLHRHPYPALGHHLQRKQQQLKMGLNLRRQQNYMYRALNMLLAVPVTQ